jgi:transcriptional activator of cad operon
MERSATSKLRVGAWCVNPRSGEISRNGETAQVEVRTMRLLVCLAEHAGEVVSVDDLLDQVWAGVTVTSDSVYQGGRVAPAAAGRRSQAAYVHRDGAAVWYRMVATVGPWAEPAIAEVGGGTESSRAADGGQPASVAMVSLAPRPQLRLRFAWIAGVVLCVALVFAFAFYGRVANNRRSAPSVVAAQPEKSIAVLAFLDLTEGMANEEFADGMTEELIDKLSKVAGLRVPGPTSSFYFKGKKVPIAEIARQLGVAYVLDGSVRKSGNRLRVAARLIRADNGYVVWSETYDRPSDDVLMVQDDIAGKVTEALRASIEARP